MARGKTKDRRIYYRLLGIVFVMVLFGLIMVLSASWVRAFASAGDSYFYLKRQLIAVAIGSVALLLFSQLSLNNMQKLARPAMIASVLMLFAVLIPGVGKTAGGATSWIAIGGFQIQPSEFAKLAIILFTADFLARKRKELNDIKELIYPYGLVVVLIIGLLMKQPDMGTALALFMTIFAMLFIGGLNLGYIALLGSGGLIAATYFIYTASYRLKRITSFLDPTADPLGSGYQINQSLLAFGSGWLFGIGLGMSRQKYFYLPEAHTDFIFAIIGEELGLIGTLFTIMLFALFTYYGIKISLRCKNHFGRLLGGGLVSMISLQALVNMGTVTGLLPITGLPLPFISYGGSSIIVNLASVGILLGIAIENEKGVSSRKRRPKLFLIENEETEDKKTTRKKRGSRRSSSKRTAAGSSKTSSTRSSKTSSKSSTRSSKKKSTATSSTRTRRTRTNASSDKRGRNSGTRVSGSSSRRSPSKGKKRT